MRYLSLFSGIGSPEEALRNIGVNFELVGFSEIDKYAIQSYCKIHNVDEKLNLGDISSIDLNLLPKDIDLITHGSPCFTADSLVLTNKGYKNIIDVCVGDEVLTHTGTYRTVTDFLEQGKKEIWEIKGMAFDKIRTTENHKFYARKRVLVSSEQSKNKVRSFENPVWVECKDLSKEYYLGMSINSESKLPIWSGVECTRGRTKYIKNDIDLTDKRFWYLCGRFVGDGWVRIRRDRNNNISGIIICCGKHEDKDFENKIGDVFKYTKVEDRTTYKYQFTNKELGTFLSQFGSGAKNKFIPGFILDLPIEYLKHFLDGYFDSDGCYYEKTKTYSATTISRELAYGIGHCIAKVYKKPFSIHKTIRPNQCIIEGRIVNQNDTYMIRFKSEYERSVSFYENGYIWYPINSIVNTGEIEDVYDITVGEDHSFVVNSCIAHNCQSFSKAGNREGGDEGSGTRSSLMWNTVAICEHSKPKFVIWENVRNVLSPRHIHNFEKYLDRMSEIGYKNHFKILNSKDFGVPQNRERIFVISIRNDIDIDFKFPKEYYNYIKLQDLLETSVDNKYYIDIETEYFGLIQDVSKDNDKEFKVRQATKQGYDIAKEGDSINLEQPNSKTRRGRVGKGVANTLNTSCNQAVVHDGRVRKMTPLEYWRLMGFSDESYYKAKEVSSDNQLYKQAGNSIVVNVMESIFVELFKEFK